MNDKYWRRRAKEFEAEWQARCQSELERELAKYFRESLSEIAEDIEALYGKYARDNQLSYREAGRLIRGDEFKSWRMSLREYLQLAHTSSAILRELNTLAMRSRISRLEKMYTETLKELQKLGERSESAVKDFLTTAYKERYYHGIYDLAGVGKLEIPVSKVEPSRLEKVLASRWQGGNYSSRIWKNTEKLSKVLKRTITEGLHRGLSVQKMSKALNAEMNAGYKNAERLVRTEMNFVQNQSARESLESAGLKEYEFIATLDHRTSQRCRSLDGTVHLLEEFDPGTNAPPMHPRCRSTISAVIEGGARTARVKGKSIRVPADMKYSDFKAVYIDKKISLEKWQINNGAEKAKAAAQPENVRRRVQEKQVLHKLAKGKPVTHLSEQELFTGFEMIESGGIEPLEKRVAQINPDYSTREYRWTHNCAQCVAAFEARSRGWRVKAKPRSSNNPAESVKDFINRGGNYAKVFKNPEFVKGTDNAQKVIEDYLKDCGEGARAMIHVTWKETGSGHIFAAENVGGKIVFVDPQTGEIGVERYFKRAILTFANRMDNQQFTNLIKDCCEVDSR